MSIIAGEPSDILLMFAELAEKIQSLRSKKKQTPEQKIEYEKLMALMKSKGFTFKEST